jgi:diguanylate cyclase (GGDEF)-like protein
MNTAIHLLCCKNILREVEQAAKTEHLDDLTITAFPSYCDVLQKIPDSASAPILNTTSIPENLFVMSCKTCPVLKHLNVPEERRITFNTVFALFLDEKLVEQKIAQGGYLVTQGWLLNWKDHSNLLGFSQENLQTFFKDFAKKIVYIDSSEESDFEHVYEFCKYIDLPYEHIPVGLDYLRLRLNHLSVRWKAANERVEYGSNLQELTKQVADYAAMFNIINELSMFTTEREVIDKIREILKMLLGATSVTYFTPESFQQKYPGLYEETLLSEFAYLEEGNGFVYAVGFRNEILGLFQINGLMFNQYMKKYLNFCLQTANILAVAIVNIRNYKKIFDMSMHDSLTGLKNRDFYEKYLAGINPEKDNRVGIVVCDVDGLKITNDTLGHKTGDRLLLRLAEILQKSFRETDIICRIGGDEFAVFVKDCTMESIVMFSDRLDYNLIQNNDLYKDDPENPALSFSYGFALHAEGYSDITSVFKIADERMYQAKRAKREKRFH